MIVSHVVKGYLDNIRQTLLADFNVLERYIYDESLDFRGRASEFLASSRETDVPDSGTPKDWVFIIWNRSELQRSEYGSRIMNVSMGINNPDIADSFTNFRVGSLSLECKIVTNNIEIAESIEEHLFVKSGENNTFEVNIANFGDFICSANTDSSTSFEKEDLKEVGSVVSIGFSSVINFPVILPPKEAKRIEHINAYIYNEHGEQLLGEIHIPEP